MTAALAGGFCPDSLPSIANAIWKVWKAPLVPVFGPNPMALMILSLADWLRRRLTAVPLGNLTES